MWGKPCPGTPGVKGRGSLGTGNRHQEIEADLEPSREKGLDREGKRNLEGRLRPRRCTMHYCKCKCKCIRNWPLPIGAFQDQCKLIVINEHNLGKNPNWREADQLAIYKRRREVELGATENNIS